MKKLILLVTALVVTATAAVAPAPAAAQTEPPQVSVKDICVMTWHHIGEICVSQVDDIAKAKAQCLATAEDKTDCARTGLIINPDLVKTDAAAVGPCIYIIQDADCIDPTRLIYVICPIGEKLGWYCIDAANGRSVETTRTGTRQCTQIDGVDGCLESYVCGPAYRGQEAVLAALRKAGITLGLPPFYCTM